MPKVMIEMEMPQYCGECRLCLVDNRKGMNYCVITACDVDSHGVARPTKCPLQEVKEAVI